MNLLPLIFALYACTAAAAEPTISVQSRTLQRGEMILVVVDGEHPKKQPTGNLAGQALQFFPAASTGTWLALYGIDLDASTGPATLQVLLHDANGQTLNKEEILAIAPGNFPVEELTVEQKYVTPSKSDTERAENERLKLHQLFTHGEEKRLFDSRFDSPIPGAATARFGERRVFNGQPRSPHSGMDLKAKKGVPIRAPAAGRTVLAGPLYFSGNTIVLDHGLGITTLYAHLSKMLVSPGSLVKKGQIIGRVGATGRVTGPHLHWGLKFREARIDPYSLTSLNLDSYLKPRSPNALIRSSACERTDLTPPPPWGPIVNGLRARIRPLKGIYSPGESVSMMCEIQNTGKKSAFIDFVLDSKARASVLGFNRPAEPFSMLTSSASLRLETEQIKIPPNKILCFEQEGDAGGPLIANATTSYALSYGTQYLYHTSTSTTRAGIWRGQLMSRPVAVTVTVPAINP